MNSQVSLIGKRNVILTNDREDGVVKKFASPIISGWRKNWIHFKLKTTLFFIAFSLFKNPLDWFKSLGFLIQLRKSFLGPFRLKKMIRVDKKYYLSLYTPGWNDNIFKRFIGSELLNFKSNDVNPYRYNHVQLAITNKCPLQCEHCYASEFLNKRDKLTKSDFKIIIERLQDLGVCQIHFTGGEPMLKISLMESLMKEADEGTNFWLNTSGFGLTNEAAKKLKSSGLTGIFISLDHFEENSHNAFRNYKDAYYWAITGARNALKNDLVVAFSLCLRNDFVSNNNLKRYMNLAKNIGVHYVQFIESKPVGNYKDKQTALSPGNIELLESLYEAYNFSNNYLDYPVITYHEYYQRRVGCFLGGKKGMYIDQYGNINACSFCHNAIGNILDEDYKESLQALNQTGCPVN
ncbi:radical SAM protein [Mangrovimonas sp. ST2L15]|uniref:radical SAM protein n=1 Tax=Mangrovimonas sp. ST2L15 TaxID=1645916 RepID=UPI0006B550EC|nr:radical SAM protein [Mangrovimonas sp. ST2L15]